MDRKQLELRLSVFLCVPALLIYVLSLRRSAACEQNHREWSSFLNDSSFKSVKELAEAGDTKALRALAAGP